MIEEQTLAAIVSKRSLTIEEVAYIGIGICFELGYAHKQGLTHGQITPDNILVWPDTKVRLLNFQNNGASDKQSDLNSVGAILRQLVEGTKAPHKLYSIARKSVSVKEDECYSTADEMQQDLERMLDDLVDPRKPWSVVTWCCVLGLAVLLYAFVFHGR